MREAYKQNMPLTARKKTVPQVYKPQEIELSLKSNVLYDRLTISMSRNEHNLTSTSTLDQVKTQP